MNKIGPYRIEDGPFEGGFGEVYRVFDTDSGDEFALKSLKGSFLSTAERLKRFRHEIDVWISIPTHPNVVRAVKAFDHGGRPYVLIEWINGGDLRTRIASLLPSRSDEIVLTGGARALEVMRQICEGMDHIHRLGLVHGDLKPSNVMMWAGTSPQITDFGFARATGEDARGLIGGTRRYMAPELETNPATISSDIYAAGVTFLEILEPFQETHFGVPEARGLALTMCREDPGERPTSFAEVESGLKTLIAGAPLPPRVTKRVGKRLTWDEQHASAIPERTQLDEARSLLAAGRSNEARVKLENLVDQKPDRTDARILLAHCLIDDGETELGAEQLRAIVQAAHGTQEQLITVANLFVNIDCLDEAEQIIDNLVDNDELAAQLGHLRADIAEKEGNLTKAIDFYRQAIDEGADNRARFALAMALKDAGFIDEAISEFSIVGKDDLDLGPKVILMLARIYVDTKRYDEAVREYRQSLRKDLGRETDAYVYAELGYIYKAQKLYDAAVRSYQKSLKLIPGAETAETGLREALEARGERSSGAEHNFIPVLSGEGSAHPVDARLAYETLTTLEHRFKGELFEDIISGVYGVTWHLLTNELIIPKLQETGRISEQEADLLNRIRKRQRHELETTDDGKEVYPDIYELLLTLHPVIGLGNENAFRGHRDRGWHLIPTIFRNNPSPMELSLRLERTCAFLSRLALLEDYREVANAGEKDAFHRLLAVAQHKGLPTHLLEFTTDMRTAAFWATYDGRLGDIGEIVLLRRHHVAKHGDIEGSPYGRFVEVLQAPSGEQVSDLFLVDQVPSVYRDPDTTFLERFAFRQDGRPFPTAGEYRWKHLSRETTWLLQLAQDSSEVPTPSDTLKRNLEWFSDHIQQVSYEAGAFASEQVYANACAYSLINALPDDSRWIDRRVAKLLADIQIDLHNAKLGGFASYALRARSAIDVYLEADGSLEERIFQALQTWKHGLIPDDEREVLDQILDDRWGKFVDNVNQD